MKTKSLKVSECIKTMRKIDGKGIPLGRLASKVALILKGKHKTTYTPHMLCGDPVIITNCKDVILTGRKIDTKVYYRHTGRLGGLKITKYKDAIAKDPTFPIKKAVERMLGSGIALKKRMMRMLFVYEGAEHPHGAQNPQEVIWTDGPSIIHGVK